MGAVLAVKGQIIKMKAIGLTAPAGENVIAFETSDTTAITIGVGGGGGSPITRFEFVKFKKMHGPSTNELFKRSVNLSHTPEITFEFYDSTATIFYIIVLKDVTVNHFSYLAPECNNCTSLFHQVWLDFARIEVTDSATGITIRFNRGNNALY